MKLMFPCFVDGLSTKTNTVCVEYCEFWQEIVLQEKILDSDMPLIPISPQFSTPEKEYGPLFLLCF